MEDDFYESFTAPQPSRASQVWESILTPKVTLALLLGPILIVFLTRYLSERSLGSHDDKNGRRVWMPPYWIPFVGHGIDL